MNFMMLHWIHRCFWKWDVPPNGSKWQSFFSKKIWWSIGLWQTNIWWFMQPFKWKVEHHRRHDPTVPRPCRLCFFFFKLYVIVWKSKVPQENNNLQIYYIIYRYIGTESVLGETSSQFASYGTNLRFLVPGYPNGRPRRTRATCRTASLTQERWHGRMVIDSGYEWWL